MVEGGDIYGSNGSKAESPGALKFARQRDRKEGFHDSSGSEMMCVKF